MKIFIIAFLTLATSSVFAKTLICEFNSSYLRKSPIVIANLDNKDLYYSRFEKSKYKISWSVSECEDSSRLTFDAKDFKDLLDGELSIEGVFEHSDPSSEIKSEVTCTLE